MKWDAEVSSVYGVCVCVCVRACACVCMCVSAFARIRMSNVGVVFRCFVLLIMICIDSDFHLNRVRSLMRSVIFSYVLH